MYFDAFVSARFGTAKMGAQSGARDATIVSAAVLCRLSATGKLPALPKAAKSFLLTSLYTFPCRYLPRSGFCDLLVRSGRCLGEADKVKPLTLQVLPVRRIFWYV